MSGNLADNSCRWRKPVEIEGEGTRASDGEKNECNRMWTLLACHSLCRHVLIGCGSRDLSWPTRANLAAVLLSSRPFCWWQYSYRTVLCLSNTFLNQLPSPDVGFMPHAYNFSCNCHLHYLPVITYCNGIPTPCHIYRLWHHLHSLHLPIYLWEI